MAKYVAFLRGIGPSNPNMRGEKLRWAFEQMGLNEVKTVISSGNVLFETERESAASLEAKIEAALPKLLGFNSSTIVRTRAEIADLVASDPFKSVVESLAEKPNVTFFKTSQSIPLPKDGEDFNIYQSTPDCICYTVDLSGPRTPDIMLRLERHYGKEITTRTWNTVLKVHKQLLGIITT